MTQLLATHQCPYKVWRKINTSPYNQLIEEVTSVGLKVLNQKGGILNLYCNTLGIYDRANDNFLISFLYL